MNRRSEQFTEPLFSFGRFFFSNSFDPENIAESRRQKGYKIEMDSHLLVAARMCWQQGLRVGGCQPAPGSRLLDVLSYASEMSAPILSLCLARSQEQLSLPCGNSECRPTQISYCMVSCHIASGRNNL